MKKGKKISAFFVIFLLTVIVGIKAFAQTGNLDCRITLIYCDQDSLVYSADKYADKQKRIDNIQVKNKIKIVYTADSDGKKLYNTEYAYRLDNCDEEYSPWSTQKTAIFVNMKEGQYTFTVKARTNTLVSEPVKLNFTVKRPFELKLKTALTLIISALTAIVVFLIIKKCRDKKHLADLTEQLSAQNEEFNNTKSQLEIQKENLNNTLQNLSVLSRSGQRIIKAMTMSNLSKVAAEELEKFFPTDGMGIGVYNAPHTSIDFSAFVLNGVTMAFARYNLENKNNLVVWSFLNHKSLVISDYKNEIGQYVDTEKFKIDTTLFGSAVYVPLSDNDMTIGVLTVKSLKNNYFTPYHLGIIHNLATYIEYAIVNISCMRKIGSQKKLLEERNVLLQTANNDLKKQQNQLVALNAELKRFSISVRNTENSVIMVDENKNISWVNYGFTKIYGYTFEEFIANGAYYKTALRNPAAIEYYDKAYEDCKPVTFTLLHYNKDDKEIWIQSSITPISDEEGKVMLIVVDTDISAVKRAEAEIRKQSDEIEQKNKEVTKSIEYASVIQSALMTGKNLLHECYKESFFLNLPKAIVSGDFFWMGQKFGRKYLALCDCAGHGVPGAFVSLMGKMFLDEILQATTANNTPGELIKELNDKLYESVSSLSTKVGGIDGMDLSLCIINENNTEVEYAGAYRPLYIVRKGELFKLLPDRCSLGNIMPGSDFQFQNSKFDIKSGDFLLMSSDGYADQFGFENGKKLGRKNFTNLIIKAAELNYDQMADFFLSEHLAWRGALEQVDDISVVGIIIP